MDNAYINRPLVSNVHQDPATTPSNHQLVFTLTCEQPMLCCAQITIPAAIVDAVYDEAARSQQRCVNTVGFIRGEIPITYIKEHFKENLIEHLKEFFLKYCVVSYLYESIRTQKIVVAGDPRLINITLEPHTDAQFNFELTRFPDVAIYEWRYLPFKAPKRKNYKDLDRQVESFLHEEKTFLDNAHTSTLTTGDWVNFDLTLVHDNNSHLFPNLKQNFWFKIGDEEIENPLRELFLNKKIGDIFYTRNKDLQAYFSDQFDTDYNFNITITDALSGMFFCIEQFKKHFRIKTQKELHQKLIEIFSYRNDLSQRRMMVEESLKLLLSKHRFSVPNHLILRQQKLLLERLQQNPDYHVYRVQKDFPTRIRQLAEKQVRETIFIDQLAYHENIAITNIDVKSYFNLTNRPRMKEFIYFELPSFKIQGQEVPILTEDIKRTCLREKTINFVIHHLMKN